MLQVPGGCRVGEDALEIRVSMASLTGQIFGTGHDWSPKRSVKTDQKRVNWEYRTILYQGQDFGTGHNFGTG